MSFTFEELQNALQNQMGGHGVKKGFRMDAIKSGVSKAATVVGGILPPTRNEMRREVAKLEVNDSQNMALALLIMERLEQRGIDLGITNEDIAEYSLELLEDYHERMEAQKEVLKQAKKAARGAKFEAFKQQWNMNETTAPQHPNETNFKEEEIVEVTPTTTASGFDEPAGEDDEVVQPATTYIFKGMPADE